jgi:hypothetical protein
MGFNQWTSVALKTLKKNKAMVRDLGIFACAVYVISQYGEAIMP